MSSLSWYGVLALALIGAVFYFVRRIPFYVALCALTVTGFAVATFSTTNASQLPEWLVMTAGLSLCVFGLLIVRVMLVRSVSLRLLSSIDEGREERMSEDIGGRLADMQKALLVQVRDGQCTLTPFGRLVGGSIAAFYSLLRIST